jgi:hypothetical protein
MLNKTMFIIIISFCFITIYIYINKYELFNSDTNLFFKPIENIFLSDNYYNYKLNKPNIKQNIQSLGEITFDSYLYSKPTSQKIICTSHKNRANCWEDNVNNCQWFYKIDGGSYCGVGQNIWP